MGIFDEIVARADERKRTTHQRQDALMAEWHKTHPTCAFEVKQVTESGNVVRDYSSKIDLRDWQGVGWFDRVTKEMPRQRKQAELISDGYEQTAVYEATDKRGYSATVDGAYWQFAEKGKVVMVDEFVSSWVTELIATVKPPPKALPRQPMLPIDFKQNALLM